MSRKSVEELFYGKEEEAGEEGTQQTQDLSAEHAFKARKPQWVEEEASSGSAEEETSSGSAKETRKEKKRRKKAQKEEKINRHPALYNFLDWVKIIAIAVAAALFLNYFVIINSTVPSGSMEPTIMTGSRMLGLRLSYTFSEPERGDIIVFKYPDDTSQNFVKRIIGLPGETVEIKDGCVYIDGEILEEDYLTVVTEGDFGPYEVPEGCYFVLGDNRNNSHDSRYWTNTYVPEEYIIGKALLCYWPLSNIGLLK